MPLDFSIKSTIEEKIKEVEKEFQRTQGLILTENDLKCLLYSKLMDIPKLSKIRVTKDPHILANAIHTEVSWYDDDKHLTIKPDITILEPEELTILHGYYGYGLPLPSKQFEFGGKAIIFELKFIRNKTGIRRRTFDGKIMKDFEKIERLFIQLKSQNMPDAIFCYFVIFNKTDRKCKEFVHFLDQRGQAKRYKVIYATGRVTFNSNAKSAKS